MNRMIHTRHPAVLLNIRVAATMLVFVIASTCRAELKDIKVPALVKGTQEADIGRLFALDVTVKGNEAAEGAFFRLNDKFKSLMSDSGGCEFRWFQVITEHSNPPFWLGAAPPSYPFVDGPSGGWDYERDPKFKYKSGKPGGDTSPFYENDDNFTPTKYSYSLYKDVHDVSKGVTKMSDGPAIPDTANSVAKFQTYLAFTDPDLRKAMQFDVLIGFSWEIGRDMDKRAYTQGPTLIDKLDLASLNKSLDPSGFKGWEAKTGLDIGCCYMPNPEPDSFTIAAICTLSLFVCRRRELLLKARVRLIARLLGAALHADSRGLVQWAARSDPRS
jgi:hypothetical protein